MTTAQIVTFADPGGLSQPDFDLNVLLRRKIIPEYLSVPYRDDDGAMRGGVGYVGWRRKIGTQAITTALQSFDLPTDFWQMKQIGFGLQSVTTQPLNFDRGELVYIGDDPGLVSQAESATIPARPSGWYLVRTASAPNQYRTAKFSCPADMPYTCRFVYYSGIVFADDVTAVELDAFIPTQFQWTLVDGLKRELYGFRFGIGDNRFQLAAEAYTQGVGSARVSPELAAGSRAKFAR